MDEQESGSSTGLVIGIIAGGIVLVLVLLLIFGAGFFFIARQEMVFHEVAAPPMEAPPPAPPQAAAPAVQGRDRLVGGWDGKTLDGDQATLEFLADGTLQSTTRPEKGEPLTTKGRWDVVDESGDRLKLRRTAADNTDSVQDLRFEGADRFVIEGKGGGVYTRKAK